MTSTDFQQRFAQTYDRARWLETLREVLPQTAIFATPQAVQNESVHAESIVQLGKVALSGDRNIALLEIIASEETDLPANRVALRHLVAGYIDLAEYHGVFAIFHQRNSNDYRFTFAAREASFDDSGNLVQKETTPRRYTYLLGPNQSCRTAAERFELLARKGASATITDIRSAFDKEPLTKEFFKRFEKAIEAVKADLEKHHSLSSAQAYSRAQLLLERLLFLYFVQNRGWLDQKRNYLLDKFQSHQVIPNESTYYADVLELVFFTLSTPPDFKGPGANLRLPGLPFLNGGLFDDDEFAQSHERRKNNPPLRIRNSTFADVFENLLEAFNFTAHEDTPIDQDVAVDPEMLGKVFESIVLHAEAADPDAVAPDKRKATGSYYTPRIVVHFICRESLCQYLLPRLESCPSPVGTGEGGRRPGEGNGNDNSTSPSDGVRGSSVWNTRLRALLDILALDGLDTEELDQLKTLITPSEGQQILDLISDLKCLDPSVGSGAFPVGLLHELLNLRRICKAAALGYVDPIRKHGNQWIHQQKAKIVENCLYGVDLQQQAIEICRLRLWLSLVVDFDLGCDPFTADAQSFRAAIRDISQLPNLEMNFRRGDSLLDMISNVPIRVNSDLLTGRSDEVREIQKLGHDLHNAKNATKKKKFRLEILRRRFDLSQRVLEDEKRLLVSGQQVGDLFGDVGSDAAMRRRAEAEIEQLNKALDKLAADHKALEKLAGKPMAGDFYRELRKLEGADFDSPFNFVWHIDYAEIFTGKPARNTLAGNLNLGDELAASKRAGGFDLIVGNPPFVTARNPVKRELYRERWKRVCHGKYLLICPFFDLSFSLLKPDGQLGFIVSNAFAKREFGKPLIEDFFPTVDLQKVVDCSGLLFPGHGTPTCIVFGAQRKSDESMPIRVAATLPGGGDLRTPPEDSPLWHALATNHDNPGFSTNQVVVANREWKEMTLWPWNFDVGPEPTKMLIEVSGHARLRDFLATDIGFMFIIGRNDIFMLPTHALRLHQITNASVRRIHPGEEIRNYTLRGQECVIFPYKHGSLELVKFVKNSPERKYFTAFTQELSDRPTFSGSFAEAGREPYEFHQLPIERAKNVNSITFPEIATHSHFVFDPNGCAFNQKGPLLKLRADASLEEHHLIAGLLNTSGVLFWLKQLCFNKGAGADEHRDRFEFAGGKVQQLPIPPIIAEQLRGKSHRLAERLAVLANACWEHGQKLATLALRKLFEQPDEAYHDWNTALPGHISPHSKLGKSFARTEQLRQAFDSAVTIRECLRAEMIALQEEMDWLAYAAYGLLPEKSSAVGRLTPCAPSSVAKRSAEDCPHYQLAEHDRPFRLWDKANGDFDDAVALIPQDWPDEQKALWKERLATIRDNEHIRRIEAPVYKRRWDEQWKVSNRWMAGPVAYAQELVDSFRWWLAEKAEWHLEHKAGGGPLSLDAWAVALADDPRVQAAWPVVAEAIQQVAVWKAESKNKKSSQPPKLDASSAAFTKFFRDTVKAETVPDGIPSAVPWVELQKKMKVPAQARKVRGKLNVPRERFRQRDDASYVWAGATES